MLIKEDDCTPKLPIPKRSDSADELEHSVSCSGLSQLQRKKKQVQFRSSADITVLSRDSLSDEFSEELESELESIFKRMRLQSKWALPEKQDGDGSEKQDSDDESLAKSPEANEGTTYFSTFVVKPSEEEPSKFSHVCNVNSRK